MRPNFFIDDDLLVVVRDPLIEQAHAEASAQSGLTRILALVLHRCSGDVQVHPGSVAYKPLQELCGGNGSGWPSPNVFHVRNRRVDQAVVFRS